MPSELKSSAKPVQTAVAAMNEALVLALVRQQEITEVADLLNEKLEQVMIARKQVEDALVRSEKLASVGRMAAVLAHEINNPLEAVTNALFLAETAEGVPKEALHYLHLADAELRRVAHITRQTLGFYRESSAPVTFQLAPLLDSVADLLEAKQISKRATTCTECDTRLEITASQGELRQVVANLLANSLDAIGEGGRITLRATACRGFRSTARCVRISISDNGLGIRGVDLANIFEPFFTTKGSTGNGLGLWISKQIVEKHGGFIQVRSRACGPRQGTTFSVVLPIAEA